MDFCCKGAKTLSVACAEKNISVDALIAELSDSKNSISSSKTQMPFNQMSAEQLISYILLHHHFYVKTAIPTIYNHLQNLNKIGKREKKSMVMQYNALFHIVV